METRANHFVIGIFVLILVSAGFGFLYWINNFGSGDGTKRYAVLFDGPVNGIARGSAVLFNGVDVGRVQTLNIDAVDTTRVRVTVDVDQNTPVRLDSRARIIQRGLTGLAAIQISAGSLNAEIMKPSTRRKVALIESKRGASSLFDAAPKVLGNADSAINQLSDILRTNSEPIRRTIENLETVTGVLAANKGEISGLITDVRGLASKIEKIEPLLDNTNSLVKRLDQVVSKNEGRIAKTLDNVESFTSELAANKGEITTIVSSMKTVTNDLRSTGKIMAEAGAVIARVDRLVDANEAGISAAVGNVQAFTAALDRNKGQVDEIFKDIRGLSVQLKSAAGKMEHTLDKVGAFMESEDGTSIVEEARAAITSFRKLAAQLEGTVGANADNLTRSTKRSLAELELFMRDGRRLARNLDRVLDGIDRNPQRLLFGGSNVPEYNPQ